jgi:hypothetical protein
MTTKNPPRIPIPEDKEIGQAFGIHLEPPDEPGGLMKIRFDFPEDPRPKAKVLEFERKEEE